MNSTASYKTSVANAEGTEKRPLTERETEEGKEDIHKHTHTRTRTHTHTEANAILNKSFIKYLKWYQCWPCHHAVYTQ